MKRNASDTRQVEPITDPLDGIRPEMSLNFTWATLGRRAAPGRAVSLRTASPAQPPTGANA